MIIEILLVTIIIQLLKYNTLQQTYSYHSDKQQGDIEKQHASSASDLLTSYFQFVLRPPGRLSLCLCLSLDSTT